MDHSHAAADLQRPLVLGHGAVSPKSPKTSVVFGSPSEPVTAEFNPELSEQAKLPTRRQLSFDEWESFKPLIKSLYIEENKTYDQVAQELRDHHNFYPT